MNRIQRLELAWIASAALIFPAGAWSDEAVAQQAEPVLAAGDQAVPAPDVAAMTADSELGSVVSEESLATARGGTETQMSENNLDAVLEDNVASNLTTGNNTITEGAFSNSTGIPMVIQNTGNNVIIQNSTILNLGLN